MPTPPNVAVSSNFIDVGPLIRARAPKKMSASPRRIPLSSPIVRRSHDVARRQTPIMTTGSVVRRLAALSFRPVSRCMPSSNGPMDARMGRRLRPTSMTLVKNRGKKGTCSFFCQSYCREGSRIIPLCRAICFDVEAIYLDVKIGEVWIERCLRPHSGPMKCRR